MNPLPFITSAYGLFQTIKADVELNKLSKEEVPTYSLTPESQSLVDLGKIGYTPQEAAVFRDNVSKNTKLAYRTAIEKAGNSFSGAVNALNVSKALGAENAFAKADADLNRSQKRTAAAITQGVSDKNTSVSLNDFNARQRAWGMSKQAGINNLFMGLASSSGLFKKADGTTGVDDSNVVSAAGLLSGMNQGLDFSTPSKNGGSIGIMGGTPKNAWGGYGNIYKTF